MEPKDRLPIGVSLLALAVAIAALVVAVSDSDSDDAVDESETSVTASAPATTQVFQTTTTVHTVQTLAPAPTTAATQLIVTATTAAESDEMADSEFSDNVLAVVGIGYDSTLNVRETPGGQIVGRLDSVAVGIVPTGTTREVSRAFWYEVHAAGVVGWVSGEYVTPLGVTIDATTQIVALLGETPSADNMTALGRIVAGAVASEEPESRVRISGAPTVGDVSEITMDVVGQPDDSIRGFRLHLFATPSDGGGSFTLRNVESTVMCYTERGVSAEGVCN